MDTRSAYIIEELYRLGPMSNQDLAKHMNLSPASITHILQPMVYHGLLRERPPEDYPDQALANAAANELKIRRKITVIPNADYGYVLAIDVTGLQIQYRKIDFGLKIDPFFILNVPISLENNLLDQIAQTVKMINNKDKRRLLALGLTIEANEKSPNKLKKAACEKSESKDPASILAKLVQLPVILTPINQALTIHEHFAGKARLLEDFFILHIHESACLGLYSKGQPHNFPISKQSTPGHWIVDPNGPQIPDSPRGSFESYVSQIAIADQLRQVGFQLQDHESYRVLETEVEKNQAASSILDRISNVTAWLCTNLMQVLCPQKIFISGPLAELGQPFLTRMQKHIRELTLPQESQQLSDTIELSNDWKRAMAIGTAHQVIAYHLASISRVNP